MKEQIDFFMFRVLIFLFNWVCLRNKCILDKEQTERIIRQTLQFIRVYMDIISIFYHIFA